MKLLSVILVVLTMSFFTHLHAQVETTEWKMPEGGDVHALINAGDTLFAYSHTGNVFLSVDDGNNWDKDLRFKLPQSNYGALFYDEDRQRLLVGHEQGLSIASGDSTISATGIPDFFGIKGGILALADFDSVLIAATNVQLTSKIIMSADGGETWTQVIDSPSGFTTLESGRVHMERLSSGQLLIASFKRVYVSDENLSELTEYSLTFSQAFNGFNVGLHDLEVVSDDEIYLATVDGLYVSTDTAKTWTQTSLTEAVTEIVQLSDGELLASSHSGVLYTSTDGENWTSVESPLNGGDISYEGFSEVLELDNGDLLASTFWIRIGGLGVQSAGTGMMRSSDGGNTWSASNAGLRNVQLFGHYYESETESMYAFAPFSGVYMTNDKGENWSMVGNPNTPDFISIEDWIAEGQYGPGWQFYSRDMFTISRNPSNGKLYSVIYTHGLELDENNDWVFKADVLEFVGGKNLTYTSDGTAFIHSRGIRTSTDGETWTALDVPMSQIAQFDLLGDVLVYHNDYGFSPPTGIFISDDMGATFTNIHEGTSSFFNDEHNNQILYTTSQEVQLSEFEVYYVPGVFRYNPESGQKDSIVYNLPEAPDPYMTIIMNDLAQTKSGAVLANLSIPVGNRGDRISEFYYSDGDDWVKLNTDNLPYMTAPSFIQGSADDEIIMLSSNGIVSVNVGDVSTSISEVNERIPAQFELLPNYPNPFNPSTQIRFNLSQTSDVKITVYSLLGQKVAQHNLGVMQTGIQEFSFNAGGLSSGMYMYQIKAGNEVRTGKMTLVK